MTGIERLRELAEGVNNGWMVVISPLHVKEIADQIEREHAQTCEDHEKQQGIIRDLQRERDDALKAAAASRFVAKELHTLAGAWDEWGLGGKLADIAEQIERERDAEVADSPYDAILPEDREAIAWVREHGGLDYMRAEWRSRVPRERYEARRQRLLDHIAECETALGRRRELISKLGHRVKDLTNENAELRRRAMPEGMEWPTVDGRKVDFKTPYQPSLGVLEAVSIYSNGACEVMSHDGIIKPVSEIHVVVLAADGEPLEVGQTVWDENGDELVIGALEDGGHTVTCRYADVGDSIPVHGMWSPSDLTHQRPVLDADGVPIREGDTVWCVGGGEPAEVAYTIEADASHPDEVVLKGYEDDWPMNADKITHTKPEPPDSWDKWRGEMLMSIKSYVSDVMGEETLGVDYSKLEDMATRDLMYRAKALAERERGE